MIWYFIKLDKAHVSIKMYVVDMAIFKNIYKCIFKETCHIIYNMYFTNYISFILLLLRKVDNEEKL